MLPLSFAPHPAVHHPVRHPEISSVYPAPTGENAGDKEKKLYYNEENQSSDVTGKDEKQMRTVQVSEITENIKEMCIEANHTLTEDMEQALNHAVTKEQAALGKQVLGQLQENLRIAREDTIPICQDTGMAVVFMEIGQDVHFEGGALEDAVNEGIRQIEEISNSEMSKLTGGLGIPGL